MISRSDADVIDSIRSGEPRGRFTLSTLRYPTPANFALDDLQFNLYHSSLLSHNLHEPHLDQLLHIQVHVRNLIARVAP